MPKKNILIKYTSRDYNSIRPDLIEHAKKYYSNTYRDFNEASFGSLMIDMTAYVGDILSFYTDYAANESFLATAIEYNNIIKHGKPLGYKFRSNPSSYGTATLYVVVPAKSVGLGPDPDYMPILLKGSSLASVDGNGFILNENIDFSDSNNEVVVASVDGTTGLPASYAIKSKGQIISGEIMQETIPVGPYQRFLRVDLSGDNVTEVLSVTDSEGHEYFETEYLSQNVIYKSIINRSADRVLTPEILKPVIVPRRFVVEQERGITQLQFGYGTDEEIKTSSVIDPTDVIMNIHGKNYSTDKSFDPSKLTQTDKFGVSPSNTNLVVFYRSNSSANSNAGAGSITEVTDPLFEFNNIINLSATKVNSVIASIEATNENPIVGDISLPSSEELKIRITDTFPTQNRAVSREDYKSVAYNMPTKFGAIKRVNVIQDSNSFKRNLNMYVISEDITGALTAATTTMKTNLKTWLGRHKMINDTIDILDAKIVNLSVEFVAVATEDSNKYSVLAAATDRLKELYDIHMDISEPFSVNAVFAKLKETEGLLDVVSVEVKVKSGGNYSSTTVSVDDMLTADGRWVRCPENCIFEVKYVGTDITGTIR